MLIRFLSSDELTVWHLKVRCLESLDQATRHPWSKLVSDLWSPQTNILMSLFSKQAIQHTVRNKTFNILIKHWVTFRTAYRQARTGWTDLGFGILRGVFKFMLARGCSRPIQSSLRRCRPIRDRSWIINWKISFRVRTLIRVVKSSQNRIGLFAKLRKSKFHKLR